MRKLLGIGAFLGIFSLFAPAYAAGFVGIQDPTNPGYVAAVDSTGHLSVTGTSTVSGNVTVVQPTGTNLHTVIDATTGVAQASTTSGQTGALSMMATTTSPPTDVNAQTNAVRGDTHGAARVVTQDTNGTVADFTSATLTITTSQYPSGATPISGNSTGTTGAVVGTLAGTGGKTTYICGFNISATGGVATLGPIVVAGLKTASQTYQLFSTVTGANLAINYGSVCIPASAVNTPITVTTTADGTATAVDVNSWGFQL